MSSPTLAAERWGVVLLHGKTGMPNQLDLYDKPLAALGVVSTRPQMCWSRQRIYDQPYLDCLHGIDEAIVSLKARGAARIVVSGQSIGANAALAYAARHEGLAGVIALAPAHYPEFISRRPEILKELARAHQLIANGKGDIRVAFTDVNSGKIISVRATPKTYVSFLAPDSPGVMPGNTARLKAPLLLVAGTEDRSQRGKDYIFGHTPAHPMNRYVTVTAGHRETPAAGRNAVLAWLRDLMRP